MQWDQAMERETDTEPQINSQQRRCAQQALYEELLRDETRFFLVSREIDLSDARAGEGRQET